MLICLMALVSAQAQTDATAARIKLIRSAYAKAKEKIEKNGKDGQSPKDMVVVTNDVTDEEADITDWNETTYYFDETYDDNSKSVKKPYFIVEKWTSHQHTLYHELLINPDDGRLMFSYRKGETDAGFVVESRYYYDAQGKLIEEKHNTPNSWSNGDSEREAASKMMEIFRLVNTSEYLSSVELTQSTLIAPKPGRIKHIREVYASAKDKIAKDAKSEYQRNVHITVRDAGDQWPPTTNELHFYFDTHCYFISQHRYFMGFDHYSEYLFEPGTTDLIFAYSRGREEGEEREWRYYFNEKGLCVEAISNAEEIDYGYSDRLAAKDYLLIYDKIIHP